ncbi:MAG: hypothetical protein PHS41_02520 [Victivallaceae bacterium]|nr:hypothetical protein [Victivallaceae bacterium]
MKDAFQTLSRKLRRNRKYNRFLAAVIGIFTVTALVSGTDPKLRNPAACAALILTAAAGWRWIDRRSRKDFVCDLDKLCHGQNTLEAWYEAQTTCHVLREVLQSRAEELCRKRKLPWKDRLFPVLLSGAVVAVGTALFFCAAGWSNSAGKVPPAPSPRTPAAAEAKLEPKKIVPFDAQLILSKPEQELRAKPLDEIDWEGAGHSTGGFKNLRLVVSVNSEFCRDFAPEQREGGKSAAEKELHFSGFLPLDELKVKPFDLVSIHLAATTLEEQSGAAAPRTVEVLSLPQFIEIRPFREDALLKKARAMSSEVAGQQQILLDVYARIHLILETQIELNKLLFRMMILTTRKSSAEAEAIHTTLLRDQRQLAGDLNTLLSENRNRTIPADSINHLELAMESMWKIEWTTAPLEIRKLQQLALSELILSLKSTQKVLILGQDSAPSPPPQPFQDRQEYSLAEKDSRESRLQQLRTRQSELNDRMKGSPSAGQSQLADAQKQLKEQLQSMRSGRTGSEKEALDRIEKKMEEAERMLRSDRNAHASIAGQQAVAMLNELSGKLRADGDAMLRGAVADAMNQLDQAAEPQRSPDARKNRLEKAGRILAEASQKQMTHGTWSNAGQLNAAAQAFQKGAAQAAADTKALTPLRETLQAMLIPPEGANALLRTVAEHLEEWKDELKFHAANLSEAQPEPPVGMSDELKMLFREAESALAQLAREQPSEKTIPRLQQRLREAKTSFDRAGQSKSSGESARRAFANLATSLNSFVKDANEYLAQICVTGHVHIFNANDVPPKYHRDVAAYFRALSEKHQEGKVRP